MDLNSPKKWYRKKRYWIGVILAFVAVVALGSGNDSQKNGAQNLSNQSGRYDLLPYVNDTASQSNTSQLETPNSTGLSNDNYYTNSSGNTVHSPVYSETVPVGATAKCRDGTYSFSQHRNGTCSHHGGVAQWL